MGVSAGIDALATAGADAGAGAAADAAFTAGAAAAGGAAADTGLATLGSSVLGADAAFGGGAVAAGAAAGDTGLATLGSSVLGADAAFGGGTAAADALGADAASTFLPATGVTTASQLSPDLAASLGIQGAADGGLATGAAALPAGAATADVTTPVISSTDLAAGASSADLGIAPSSGLDDVAATLKKLGLTPASAAMLGISGAQALSKPKLPGSYNTLQANAGAQLPQEQAIINSGGTAAPQWASQKQAIDAQYDQMLQQQTEALKQTLASSGQGGSNSAVIQQKIAQLTQTINQQRQQAYLQAQQANVNQAIQLMTGNNNILSGIGATQLQQSTAAQQTAAQTAELALLLQSRSGSAADSGGGGG